MKKEGEVLRIGIGGNGFLVIKDALIGYEEEGRLMMVVVVVVEPNSGGNGQWIEEDLIKVRDERIKRNSTRDDDVEDVVLARKS